MVIKKPLGIITYRDSRTGKLHVIKIHEKFWGESYLPNEAQLIKYLGDNLYVNLTTPSFSLTP